MKIISIHVLSTCIAILSYTFSFGQQSNMDSLFLKKGIYRSFSEFKSNSPSIELKYTIDTISRHYGFANLANKLIAYRLDLEKSDIKDIDSIFGFCDGQYVYINEFFPNTKKRTVFYRLENIGRYCFYYSVADNYSTISMGVNHTQMTRARSLDENMLSLKTGNIYILDKKVVEELIQKDTELLEQFKQDKEKKKHFKEYMIRFSERNPLSFK